MTRHTIEVYNTTQVWVPRRALVRLAVLVMKRVGVGQYVLSIIFIADVRMKKLNRQWRGKDSTTDVLSFTYTEKPLHGEIYISIPQARRQAAEYGHSLKTEIEQLVIHGLLHIVGHDHEKKKDAEAMKQLEEKIWREFAQSKN